MATIKRGGWELSEERWAALDAATDLRIRIFRTRDRKGRVWHEAQLWSAALGKDFLLGCAEPRRTEIEARRAAEDLAARTGLKLSLVPLLMPVENKV